MTEQLIKYNTAVLAKEKGFDIKQARAYNAFGGLSCIDRENRSDLRLVEDNPEYGPHFEAPTQSLLQKWLRDIHGWHILVIPVITMHYTFKIMKVWKKDYNPDLEIETPPYSGVDAYDYDNYEEALEAGLLESLKLV